MSKVLITGTTRSGKSTLVKEIESLSLPNLVIIPELALNLLKANPSLEKDPNLQDILFAEQLKREREAFESGAKFIICDRGIPDNIAHAKLFGQEIKPEWIDYSRTYNMVFLCNKDDVDFNLTNVQAAMENRNWIKYREDQDTQIKAALALCGLPYILLEGTVTQRRELLETALWPTRLGFEGNFTTRKEG